jgi:hypothetical protein
MKNILIQAGEALQREADNTVPNAPKLKITEPFSKRLNDFIRGKAEEIKEHTTFLVCGKDDFDENDIEGTFQRHLKRWETDREIQIWTGGSSCTIFGDPHVNALFRFWHDYIHLSRGLGYSLADEIAVAEIQKAELPSHWVLERELIHADVSLQALYHERHKEFVDDQRKFVYCYLKGAYNPYQRY